MKQFTDLREAGLKGRADKAIIGLFRLEHGIKNGVFVHVFHGKIGFFKKRLDGLSQGYVYGTTDGQEAGIVSH